MRRKVKKIFSVILLASLLVGCGDTEAEVMPEDILVETMKPIQGEFAVANEFIGTISPEEAVYVIPFVSGEVEETYVSVGDTVSEGDILAQIDDESAQLQLASAQASYDTAEASKKQTLGGSWDLKTQQTESSINQLQNQTTDLQETIDDSKTFLGNVDGDLAQVTKWEEDTKDDLEDEGKAYAKIAGFANTYQAVISALQAAGVGVAEGGLGTYISTVISLPAASLSDADKAASTAIAQGQGLLQALSAAGLSESSVTSNGLAMAQASYQSAQSAYTGAATRKAKLEQTQIGYVNGIESEQDNLEDLNDNISTAQTAGDLTNGQVKQETEAVLNAQINAAGVGVKSAQYQIDMYKITAPISGVVEAANISAHDVATSSTPAYIISNKDSMMVTFSVSESIQPTLSVGQKILIDQNGVQYGGTITEVPTMVDSTTGLFTIKANLPVNGDSICSGTIVKVIADTYKEDNTLQIPYDAVYYDNGQAYVYCIESGLAKRYDIETGIFNNETMTVISGITGESNLITTWATGLRDGAVVSVKGAENEINAGEELKLETGKKETIENSTTKEPTKECESLTDAGVETVE